MSLHRVVIELAPYHAASPCTLIITSPVTFFLDSGAKTSMSLTACLAPHPFFCSCFEREQDQKSQNHRQRFQICSLSTKNKPRGRMQCKINTGLIETEWSQVIGTCWLRYTHLSHIDGHTFQCRHKQTVIHTH